MHIYISTAPAEINNTIKTNTCMLERQTQEHEY